MNCKERIKADNGPCKHYIKPKMSNTAGYCKLNGKYRCTEALKHYLSSLSHSSRMDWASCKMKYYYRQIMGLQCKPEHMPKPMVMGIYWDEVQRYLNEANKQQIEFTIEENLFKYLKGDKLGSKIWAARLYALCRAYFELGLSEKKQQFDPTLDIPTYQKLIEIDVDNAKTIGYIDQSYSDYFVETKLSSRPEFYKNLHSISSQVGTYFLGNPDYKYCIMEITRLPGQKTGKGKFEQEDPESFEERIFQDIISRPSYYFIGYNRKNKTFGVKFWRNEFDLDEIKRNYQHIEKEIRYTIDNDAWYKNYLACHVPTQCIYYPVCATGVVSDEIYEIREKGINNE